MALDDDPLLHKVDAFINRLRPPAEDDVPVLTDVVDHPLAVPIPHTAPAIDMSALSSAIQATVAREIDNWLDLNLPDIVLRVLDGVADQLILQVGDQARKDLLPALQAALRDACENGASHPPSARR